ncbi:hypothetical protein [Burkholderia sp. AW49-1]
MYHLAIDLIDDRNDRFDAMLSNPTVRGIRCRDETRRAALRVRKHAALLAQARNQARHLAAEPAPTADSSSVRDTLAAWDAAQADARAHFAAAEEAYRLSRLLPTEPDEVKLSPVFAAMLNHLNPTTAA